MMNIIDTHAHLDHLKDLDKALAEADQAGVTGIVAVSMDLASCRKNLEIKRRTQKPAIFLAMGMHPSEVNLDELEPMVEYIKENAAELTAIGEIGLDFWYKWVRKDTGKKEDQRKVFRTLLSLAKDLNLPVVIHSRGTWRECLETARSLGIEKAVFHWYSGPVDVLKDILAAGYYVSATPALSGSPPARDAIRQAPIERILLETDSPVYYRNQNAAEEGFEAEPKDVWMTWRTICSFKGIEEKEALKIFSQNVQFFFNLRDNFGC